MTNLQSEVFPIKFEKEMTKIIRFELDQTLFQYAQFIFNIQTYK